MGQFKAKFAVGDTVYTATKNGVDKHIISAVKFSGFTPDTEKVEYSFKSNNDGGDYIRSMWTISFESFTSWWTEDDFFTDAKEADKAHKVLKAEADEKAKAEQIEERENKIKELKHRLEQMEAGKADPGEDCDCC